MYNNVFCFSKRKKKRITWLPINVSLGSFVFRVKFYLEQNEHCRLRDSISDSSEKLLQGGKEGNQVI